MEDKEARSSICTGSHLHHRTFRPEDPWTSLESTILAGNVSLDGEAASDDQLNDLSTVPEERERSCMILPSIDLEPIVDDNVLNMNIDAISDDEVFFDCSTSPCPSPRKYFHSPNGKIFNASPRPFSKRSLTPRYGQYLQVGDCTSSAEATTSSSNVEGSSVETCQRTGRLIVQIVDDFNDMKDHAQSTPKPEDADSGYFQLPPEDSRSNGGDGGAAAKSGPAVPPHKKSLAPRKSPTDGTKLMLPTGAKLRLPSSGKLRSPSSGAKLRTPSSDAKLRTPSSDAKLRSPSSGAKLGSPSSGKHKSPSSGKHKSPSSGKHKSPSSGKHKSPSSGKHKSPSRQKSPTFRTMSRVEPRHKENYYRGKYSMAVTASRPRRVSQMKEFFESRILNESLTSQRQPPKATPSIHFKTTIRVKSTNDLRSYGSIASEARSSRKRSARALSCSECSSTESSVSRATNNRSKSTSDATSDNSAERMKVQRVNNVGVRRYTPNTLRMRLHANSPKESTIKQRKSFGYVSSPIKPVREIRKLFSPSFQGNKTENSKSKPKVFKTSFIYANQK